MHIGVGWGQEAARNEMKARIIWELHCGCAGRWGGSGRGWAPNVRVGVANGQLLWHQGLIRNEMGQLKSHRDLQSGTEE